MIISLKSSDKNFVPENHSNGKKKKKVQKSKTVDVAPVRKKDEML